MPRSQVDAEHSLLTRLVWVVAVDQAFNLQWWIAVKDEVLASPTRSPTVNIISENSIQVLKFIITRLSTPHVHGHKVGFRLYSLWSRLFPRFANLAQSEKFLIRHLLVYVLEWSCSFPHTLASSCVLVINYTCESLNLQGCTGACKLYCNEIAPDGKQ